MLEVHQKVLMLWPCICSQKLMITWTVADDDLGLSSNHSILLQHLYGLVALVLVLPLEFCQADTYLVKEVFNNDLSTIIPR